MANVSRVNGFNPIGFGGDYTAGKVGYYSVAAADATAIYLGDLVKFDGSSDATGIPSVTKVATTTVPIVGVVVGFSVDPTNLGIPSQYRSASTLRYVYVADNPMQIFEVQSSNGTPAVTDIGMNVAFADAGGSTITGLSGMTVDFGALTTLNTAQFKLVGFTQRGDNEIAANAKLMVRINLHQFVSATGSLGV